MKTPHKRIVHKLTVILLLATVTASANATGFERLTRTVEEGMELWHVPGMAVTVVSSDDVLYQQGFGETSIENGAAVDEHTLFAIASTTKAMVTAGILMLVDENKLSLDDPIVRYIPELHFSDPMLTQQVTVRDLLSHRTGLPSTDFWTFFQTMPMDEQIRRLADVKPAAGLRTRLIYQNTMFELAGLVIERLSEQRWDHFLRDRLWRPLGMNETFGARGDIEESLLFVRPHDYRDGELMLIEWDLPADQADAAGSAWSSIHDMALWAQFLLRGGVTADGKRLVSESGMSQMFEPQQLASPGDFYPTIELTKPNWRSYGLAWFQQDFQGRKIDFHTGSLGGLVAIIGLDPTNDRALVVLGNRDHAEVRHALLWEVMDTSPAEQRRNWNREVFELYASQSSRLGEKRVEMETQRLKDTRLSLPLEGYAGEYDGPITGVVSIGVSGDGLSLLTDSVELPMSHWHMDTFLLEYEPWGLSEFAVFRIGPDGSIAGLELFGERLTPVGSVE